MPSPGCMLALTLIGAKWVTGTANPTISCMKLFYESYVRFSTYKEIPFCRFWKYTGAHA